MKILIVTQYFWPENFKITDLAKGLSDRGHEITVLTGKPNYPIGKLYPGYRVLGVQKERHGDISIIRTPLIPRGRSKVSLALNYVSFALTATLLAGFKSFKPEIIFVYGPSPVTACLPAIFLKKQNKVPLLFWVQDLWPESVVAVNALKNRLMLRLLHKLVYFIYKHCDQILSSSLAYFSSIKKFDIADEKLKYFPQTADKSYRPIEPHVCDEEDRLLPKGFRILFSGNLGIAQDLPFILNAAERLKHETEIKWIFIGDGSKRVWLQNQILKRQLTKTVFWLGAYPSIKMPYFFSVVDCLMITLKPNALFALTLPGKLQSYLACAKPILANLQGEGRRIVEETGAGFVSANGSIEAFVEIVMAMKKLTLEERQSMGQRGRDYFEKHFHRDALLQNLEQWMFRLKENNYK